MKNILLPIITGVVLGAIGFFTGHEIGHENGLELGYQNGFDSARVDFKSRSIDEIKSELRGREESEILSYLNGTANIKTVDEGSFFTTKNVQYLMGSLTSSATLAIVKDVKINIDFFSKTGAKIGAKEMTIYEFVQPGGKITFKEKINIPEKVVEFKFEILDAGVN